MKARTFWYIWYLWQKILTKFFWRCKKVDLLKKTSKTKDRFFLMIRNFVGENLCDEVLIIKNLRWQFCGIFCWLRHGLLYFFCPRCFHGEICNIKWPLSELISAVNIKIFLKKETLSMTYRDKIMQHLTKTINKMKYLYQYNLYF